MEQNNNKKETNKTQNNFCKTNLLSCLDSLSNNDLSNTCKREFTPKDISTLYKNDKRLPQSQEALQFIESKWNEFLNNNSKAFNGPLFHVDKYDIIANNLIKLELSIQTIRNLSEQEVMNLLIGLVKNTWLVLCLLELCW